MKWFKNKFVGQRSTSNYSEGDDPSQFADHDFQGVNLSNKRNIGGGNGAQSHQMLSDLNQVQSANYELKDFDGPTRRAINFEKFNQEFKMEEKLQQKKKAEIFHLKKQNLPVDFAGRVLKLEMQIEKGLNFTTTDDVQNLMDLYTQAVEYYNSTQQLDRQKYYETKLHKLMNSPQIKRLYKMAFENDKNDTKSADDKKDGSQTPNKKKTMQEMLQERDKQRKKQKAQLYMETTRHQIEKELEQPEVKLQQEKQIKQAQQKRDDTKKMLNTQFARNRDDIQKRVAERARRRTSSRGKMNQSMLQSSQGLQAFSVALQNQKSATKPEHSVRTGRATGSILLPSTSHDLSNLNPQTPTVGGVGKNKYADRDFQLGKGNSDYVKNLLRQNNSFMKGFGTFDKMKSPRGNNGPQFGQSKLGMSSNMSSYSGRDSSQSMGGGVASRFQLALSRVIDPTAESSMTGATATEGDDDIQEIRNLVEEMNQHSDLTVKLSNQAKLCKIFQKGAGPSKNTSLMKRKLEENLKNLDPEIKKIFNDCKLELEALQQKKEQAIDEFIELQTENKIVQQRKIERKFKKRCADIDKSIKSLETENPNQHKEAISMLNQQKEGINKDKQTDVEKFVQEQDVTKKKGLQEIKDKYNNLCQKINLDTNALLTAIQKKKQQDKEALEKQQKQSSSEQQKEEMVPVKVEDMSDKGDGTPTEKEPIFQMKEDRKIVNPSTDAPAKESQGEEAPQNDDEKKAAEPEVEDSNTVAKDEKKEEEVKDNNDI